MLRLLALSVLILLSTPSFARADDDIARCVNMRLDADYAPRVGYALKRMKQRDIDIPSGDITIQPAMAGLRGPKVTFFGRDVRLAVTKGQTSPQELWLRARWNQKDFPCPPAKQSWKKSLTRGLHWKSVFDNSIGFTTYEPKILFSSRYLFETMIVRPRGFTLGSSIALPLANNTEALLYLPDNRAPVRRDMARFYNGVSLERLYASWKTTPITDVHLSLTAGWLEAMYGGAGAEIVYRPFGSPFWVGADGWKTWRREPDSIFNAHWSRETHFTGHVRVGFDKPETRFGVSLAAGRYLAGDHGATLEAVQGFDNGIRLTGSLTWTNRHENEGFFKNSQFDPMIRLVWPLGETHHREIRTAFRQMGRDGGQMLDRPQPLETMTEAFSTREIIRSWASMFE